jgi:hypothetical protein
MTGFQVPAALLGETVSHGTLNSWHLASRFVTLFEEMEHPDAAMLRDSLRTIEAAQDEDEIEYLVDDLFYILYYTAPDGYTFGAHAGDASDFGFWAVEDEEA